MLRMWQKCDVIHRISGPFIKKCKHYPVPKEYEEYFKLSKYHLRGKGLTIISIVVIIVVVVLLLLLLLLLLCVLISR